MSIPHSETASLIEPAREATHAMPKLLLPPNAGMDHSDIQRQIEIPDSVKTLEQLVGNFGESETTREVSPQITLDDMTWQKVGEPRVDVPADLKTAELLRKYDSYKYVAARIKEEADKIMSSPTSNVRFVVDAPGLQMFKRYEYRERPDVLNLYALLADKFFGSYGFNDRNTTEAVRAGIDGAIPALETIPGSDSRHNMYRNIGEKGLNDAALSQLPNGAQPVEQAIFQRLEPRRMGYENEGAFEDRKRHTFDAAVLAAFAAGNPRVAFRMILAADQYLSKTGEIDPRAAAWRRVQTSGILDVTRELYPLAALEKLEDCMAQMGTGDFEGFANLNVIPEAELSALQQEGMIKIRQESAYLRQGWQEAQKVAKIDEREKALSDEFIEETVRTNMLEGGSILALEEAVAQNVRVVTRGKAANVLAQAIADRLHPELALGAQVAARMQNREHAQLHRGNEFPYQMEGASSTEKINYVMGVGTYSPPEFDRKIVNALINRGHDLETRRNLFLLFAKNPSIFLHYVHKASEKMAQDKDTDGINPTQEEQHARRRELLEKTAERIIPLGQLLVTLADEPQTARLLETEFGFAKGAFSETYADNLSTLLQQAFSEVIVLDEQGGQISLYDKVVAKQIGQEEFDAKAVADVVKLLQDETRIEVTSKVAQVREIERRLPVMELPPLQAQLAQLEAENKARADMRAALRAEADALNESLVSIGTEISRLNDLPITTGLIASRLPNAFTARKKELQLAELQARHSSLQDKSMAKWTEYSSAPYADEGAAAKLKLQIEKIQAWQAQLRERDAQQRQEPV